MNSVLAASVIFFLSYSALVVFKAWKSHILWFGIATGVLFGLIKAHDILFDINWNVMGIFAGTLVLAEFFVLSRVPEAIAVFLINRSSSAGAAFFYVCLFSSLLSICIENVAVVLIVAPIAIELARKIDVSPVPVIVGIAIASNLQGTATLIGDPPSMILANYKSMNFNDFFVYNGKPGIFFAVEAGAVGAMLVLYMFFRHYRKPVSYEQRLRIRTLIPTYLLMAMIIGLSLSSIIDPDFKWFGGVLCVFLALVCTLATSAAWREKVRLLRGYDWKTTAFLAGVFVMVGMLERVGVIEIASKYLSAQMGDNQLMTFLVIVWGSVALSAFVDNVPYITAMIPIIRILSHDLAISEELLVFGLLIGACLGGNITPVGASANVVSTGILRKNGYVISFGQFIKIGLPFTLVATTIGSAVIYLVWR